jgi:hypothetical protein
MCFGLTATNYNHPFAPVVTAVDECPVASIPGLVDENLHSNTDYSQVIMTYYGSSIFPCLLRTITENQFFAIFSASKPSQAILTLGARRA